MLVVAALAPAPLAAATTRPSPRETAVPAAAPAPAPPPSFAATTPAPASAPVPAPPAPPEIREAPAREDLPASVTMGLGVLLAAVLAGLVGHCITATWDLRRKRTAIDLQLADDLNRAIAAFEALDHERDVLRGRGDGLPRPEVLAEIRQACIGLSARAVLAESGLEAVLLRMVADMEVGLAGMSAGAARQERARQIRVMGLMRLMFRRLREALGQARLEGPGVSEAAGWLFERLAADLTGLLAARALRPSPGMWRRRRRKTIARTPSAAATALRVMAYRMADLEVAEAAMQEAVCAYREQRDIERRAAWQRNVHRLFPQESIVVYSSEGTIADISVVGRNDPNRPIVVLIAERGTESDAAVLANKFFADRNRLRWVVVLVGRNARLLVQPAHTRMSELRATDPLPEGLLRDAGIPVTTPQQRAVLLLGWAQAGAAPNELEGMADA